MPNLSEQCKERLRDIDKRLTQILSDRTPSGCLDVLEQIRDASSVDNGCLEFLRSIEREIQNLVEEPGILERERLPEYLLNKLRSLQSTIGQVVGKEELRGNETPPPRKQSAAG
jgi:hypothetical protein